MAVSFITSSLVSEMLEIPHIQSTEKPTLIILHVGNPGPGGLEHRAAESTEKPFSWTNTTGEQRFISNAAAIEWVEVKFKETYAFVSLWKGGTGKYQGYAELAAPIPVEIGDTVRFNIGALVLEVP